AEDVVQAVLPGEVIEVVADLVGKLQKVPVDQAGRAEGNVLGEDDLAADRADSLGLPGDVPDYVLQVAELAALDEGVRPEQVDGFDGGRPAVDGHIIDVTEGGKHLGPQSFRKGRSVRPLVDVAVRGEGNNQDVPEGPRLGEVSHVAGVQQVKHPVAQ